MNNEALLEKLEEVTNILKAQNQDKNYDESLGHVVTEAIALIERAKSEAVDIIERAKFEKMEEEYLQNNGLTCLNPKCDSTDLEGGSIEIDGPIAVQSITCNKCGSSWSDIYKLHGVDDVELENE